MRFVVLMAEPPGYGHAYYWYDICRYLCRGIEALGHECVMSRNELVSGRVPIVVAYCHMERFGRGLVDRIAAGGPYAVYQTELVARSLVPGVAGFSLSPPAHGRADSVARFTEIHLPLMRRAAAVWSPSLCNLAPLAELGVQAEHVPLGWLPTMREVVAKRVQDIDFLFYGSPCTHKEQMLAALKARGASVVMGGDAVWHYRNDLIARAKVHLVPHRGQGQECIGQGKLAYLLDQGALCVVERCAEWERWAGCCVIADMADWVEACLQTLARPDRAALAATFAAHYREIPFTAALAPALERLIKGLGMADASGRRGTCQAPRTPRATQSAADTAASGVAAASVSPRPAVADASTRAGREGAA